MATMKDVERFVIDRNVRGLIGTAYAERGRMYSKEAEDVIKAAQEALVTILPTLEVNELVPIAYYSTPFHALSFNNFWKRYYEAIKDRVIAVLAQPMPDNSGLGLLILKITDFCNEAGLTEIRLAKKHNSWRETLFSLRKVNQRNLLNE